MPMTDRNKSIREKKHSPYTINEKASFHSRKEAIGTAGYQMRRPVVMSWLLGLEEISQANLPRVVAAS